MGKAEKKRESIKKKIEKIGGTGSFYSYSDAIITTNEEGDETITWGSSNTFYFISEEHHTFRLLNQSHGAESNEGDRSLLVPYDTDIGEKDKIVIGEEIYMVGGIEILDPIEGTALAFIITLFKNERYANA